jgi:hypothetical protein
MGEKKTKKRERERGCETKAAKARGDSFWGGRFF